MAAIRRVAVFGASMVGVSSVSVKDSPLQKVLDLIGNLKTEVEDEGKAEATQYDKFACFCKSKTTSLSTSIKDNQDKIDSLSSDIESNTATESEKKELLAKKKQQKEDLAKELGKLEARCARDKANYEADSADLVKAIAGLTDGIKAIELTKPALLDVKQGATAVRQSLALAQALKLIDHATVDTIGTKMQSFLQVDPNDPDAKFHSQDILTLLNKLLTDFTGQKSTLDTEWSKTEGSCTSEQTTLSDDITSKGTAITGLNGDISGLETSIGTDRGELVTQNAELKDSKLYLEDLTKMCEQRAQDWDQRSSSRAEEIQALTKALNTLTDSATGAQAVEGVNERALLQMSSTHTRVATGAVTVAAPAQAAKSSPAATPSFLQVERLRLNGRRSSAAAASGTQASAAALAAAQARRKSMAIATLREAGSRLHSTALSELAAHASADPFGKIKKLIQGLIERLVKEATDEAGKKGFCDKKLGTTKQERDFRLQDVNKAAAEIISLKAKKDALTLEISELGSQILQLNTDLTAAQTLRSNEHTNNLDTIKDAKRGSKAVASAIDTLTVFYNKQSQALVQTAASKNSKKGPVEEDLESEGAGAGFKGSNKGKQASAGGIIGILEVVKSDFDHTLDRTNKEEAAAHAKFTEFERASLADVKGKTTAKELNEEEKIAVQTKKTTKQDAMKTSMDLVDSAVKQLEKLYPVCVDSGMSAEDRNAKRDAEVAALKKASCMLEEGNAEADCQ